MAFVTRSMPDRTPSHKHGGRGGQHDERQAAVEEPVAGEVGKERPSRVGAAADRPGGGEPDIGDRPAGDDGVEGENARAGEAAERPNQPPGRARLDRQERAYRVLLRAPAQGELRNHDREADEQDAR